jgi:hypothetical protein
LLVPMGDIDGLAAAMARMIADADLRRAMTASTAVSRAALHPDRILGEWDRLIAGVMRNRRLPSQARASSAASS